MITYRYSKQRTHKFQRLHILQFDRCSRSERNNFVQNQLSSVNSSKCNLLD